MTRMIAHYRIVRKLGVGGAARVYLARDLNTDRDVALKVLHADLTRNPNFVKRFEQEAEWVSFIVHPNVLAVYEIGQRDNLHYMATEYIDGVTVRDLLDQEIPIQRVLEIAAGVASALTAAHAAWVVHRDIKPENIMLGRDGRIKVLDFGFAKLMQGEPSTGRLTRPGMVVGTLQYLAPEQIHGEGVDTRTDIWGLGVLMYEMITGVPPFDGHSQEGVVSEILRKEPAALERLSEQVPAEIQTIVSKALEKDMEERYPRARDMMSDIRKAQHSLGFL